jgi:putative ABC transport system ATP-binding protein
VVRDVRKTFGSRAAPVRALRDVSLDVSRGEYVAVVGPSGCGKSTLLNVIAGLDTADDGEIWLGGERLTDRGEDDRTRLRRRHVGMVFQFFNLLPSMTALENVAFPMMITGTGPRSTLQRRARDVLELVGIPDKAAQYPGTLSGGQQQRVAIARALVAAPTVVLADEPTGALDSAGAAEIGELLRRVSGQGQTILLVTHDVSLTATAGRAVPMRDGLLAGRHDEDRPAAARSQG